MNNKLNKMEEKKSNPTADKFNRLVKKFDLIQIKNQEEKLAHEKNAMFEKFDQQTKNFESNLYNAKLYNGTFPMREISLDAKYEVSTELEEFIYTEYFRDMYPYSSVTVEKINENRKVIKIILLDDDKERFLNKNNIIIEERHIPENYFLKLK
jgi:hypothetical protein